MLKVPEKNIFISIVYTIIILGVIAASFVAYQRIGSEINNNKVEMVVDLRDLAALSSLSGTPLRDILYKVKKAGITSLAVYEDTLHALEKEGKLNCFSGYEVINDIQINKINSTIQYLMRNINIKPSHTYISIPDTFLFDRVKASFIQEVGENNVRIFANNLLEINSKKHDILKIGLGFSSGNLLTLNNYGFVIIPRLFNSFRLDNNRLALKLNNISEIGKIHTIIFGGNSVLGYPNNLSVVSKKLKRYGINYGFIEFGKQKGSIKLAHIIPEKTIKTHSIPQAELRKLSQKTVIARYLRAVEERGVRILYIYPWLDFRIDRDLLSYNIHYFRTLKNKIEQRRYKVAPVKESLSVLPSSNKWLILIVRMSILMLIIILITIFNPSIPIRLLYGIFAFCISLALANTFILPENTIVQKLYALLGAIIAPAIIILHNFSDFEELKSAKNKVIITSKKVGLVFIESLIAGLLTSSLISETKFLLAINTFSGIKIAFILPFLIVGFYLLFSPFQLKSIPYKLKRILEGQVTIGHMMIMGALSLGLLLLLVRSGNNTGFMITGLETKVRIILEKLFFIRPRFKEFFIGYPALILLCWFAGSYISKRWKGLFIIAGTLVPISIINSFCHLHTPFLYSIWRSFNGLVLGTILCAGAILLLHFLIKLGHFVFD